MLRVLEDDIPGTVDSRLRATTRDAGPIVTCAEGSSGRDEPDTKATTAADRINAPSKHFTLTVGDRELVAQNVILIVQINTHIMTVILRYCGPFYDAPMHTFMFAESYGFGSRTSENPRRLTFLSIVFSANFQKSVSRKRLVRMT